MTTFQLVPPKDSDINIVGGAITAAAELFGWQKLSAPEFPDYILCLTAEDAKRALESSPKILHVGMGRSDGPLTFLANQHPGKYEYASSIGYNNHPDIVTKIRELDSMGDAAQAIANAEKSTEQSAIFELPELTPCPINGKQVVVVDDKEINRRSAVAQFGPSNNVSQFGSYVELCKALQQKSIPLPDVILADMLMPTERYMLGEVTFCAYQGSDFPAGLFVATVAAQCGVPLVVIQTDAGHHDHPALAMVDLIGWDREFRMENTRVLIRRAHVTSGVKDWGLGLKGVAVSA